MRAPPVTLAVAAILALGACAGGPSAPPAGAAASTFDRVLAIDLSMSVAAWTELRGETRSWADVYGACLARPFASPYHDHDASVTIDGQPLGHAVVRKRGFLGSLSETKPSLRISLDGAGDPRLDGGRHLLLNNAVQDPSYVRQCLAYRFFAGAGVLAPRCGFARVRVNGVDLGLYVHVERIDATFVAHHAAGEPALYEGTFSDFRAGWTATFERKAGSPAAGAIDALAQALARPDDELLAAVEQRVDVDEFLTYWASEALIGQRDGYAGNANNFYVRLDAADGRFHFIPWGTDGTFRTGPDPLASGATSLTARSFLPWRLYALPAIRAAYAARMRELLATRWDEPALLGELDRMQALIAPAAGDAAALSARIDEVRAFVRGRRAAVLAELDAGTPRWTAPPLTAPCLDVVGELDVELSTRWGTLGGDALALGDATVAVTVGGVALPVAEAGAIAGVDPADPTRGQLRVVATLTGGDAVLLVVQLDLSALRAATTIALDGVHATGHVYRYAPVAGLTLLGQAPLGTLEILDGSPAAGAPLRARLRAPIVRRPDDQSRAVGHSVVPPPVPM